MNAIDLFAGLGGSSTGIEQAGGRVLWAANHWPVAVQWHAANHPRTVHSCQDLQQADFYEVPDCDLMVASPSCQGHSNARGKERAGHDKSRSTAWAAITAAEAKRPPVVVVENVPEFVRWELYPRWIGCLGDLGYSVAPHIIDAADLGVPQHRKRLFMVCTQSKNPVHLALQTQVHVPASAVVDLEAGSWSSVDKPGRSEFWKRKAEEGAKAHGGHPFILRYFTTEKPWRSFDAPMPTVTTIDHNYIVADGRMRRLTKTELCRAMGFPEKTKLPEGREISGKLLGNAVCPPVMREIVQAIGRQG